MSSKKNSHFVFLILSYLFTTTLRAQDSLHYCEGTYLNYTIYSPYKNNLMAAFAALSNVDQNGFYSTSVGERPDQAGALVLCRGDAQFDLCRTCIKNAISEIQRWCPYQGQAIIYFDPCTLRYWNNEYRVPTQYQMENYWGVVVNPLICPNPSVFTADLETLLNDLQRQASSGNSLRKVASGNINTAGFQTIQTIYALVQCTPDLSAGDCSDCLVRAALHLRQCCYSSIGARVLFSSCNIHYEIHSFVNETRLSELLTVPTPPMAATPFVAVPNPPLAPTTILTVPNPSMPLPPSGNGNKRTIIIVVISTVAGLVLFAVFVGLFLRKRSMQKSKEHGDQVMDDIESIQYDFARIRNATNDFSDANKLGKGGFGFVYKGILSNGQEIAVKRLSINSSQGDREFKNEVVLLIKLQHRNLVRLLGFSIEGNEKLLVYEFVQNASLDTFLFDLTKRSNLDWETRYKIIVGIAKGMLYLHEDSRLRIIHRDLKPGNVLLDGEMNPKIADFGMAKLFVPDETHGSTRRIVGTHGYMSPEYFRDGQFSIKSDVYSFGVLVLEIIAGQKNKCFRNGENVEDLLSITWKNWRNEKADNSIDPLLKESSVISRDILKCIHIGLLCVQENAIDRPTMASVVLMLNSFSITQVPSQPAFFGRSDPGQEVSLLQDFNNYTGIDKERGS